jgi:hypothetical protein
MNFLKQHKIKPTPTHEVGGGYWETYMFRERIQELRDLTNWSDFSLIELLTEFIVDENLQDLCIGFLKQRAEEEIDNSTIY